jgi:uncharacterized protein (DUF2235 family)
LQRQREPYSVCLANVSPEEKNEHSIQTGTTFRETFSRKNFSIHFIGLWDTVSSVGWITTPLRLLDMAENPIIQRGRHAVSIDERRCFYRDNLYGEPVKVEVPVALASTPAVATIPEIQDVLQVWFSGVHSDSHAFFIKICACFLGLLDHPLRRSIRQPAL